MTGNTIFHCHIPLPLLFLGLNCKKPARLEAIWLKVYIYTSVSVHVCGNNILHLVLIFCNLCRVFNTTSFFYSGISLKRMWIQKESSKIKNSVTKKETKITRTKVMRRIMRKIQDSPLQVLYFQLLHSRILKVFLLFASLM